MIVIQWIFAVYVFVSCAAIGRLWRKLRRIERRLRQAPDPAGTAACAQANAAYEAPSALERRVEELEQAMDMAAERHRKEFDITEGLASLLSYDPYAAMRRKDDLDVQ